MSIEKLKAAYEASTQGEWETYKDDESKWGAVTTSAGRVICRMAKQAGDEAPNAQFITLAHNIMPELLEMALWMDSYLELHRADNEDAWIVRETLYRINAKLKAQP